MISATSDMEYSYERSIKVTPPLTYNITISVNRGKIPLEFEYFFHTNKLNFQQKARVIENPSL